MMDVKKYLIYIAYAGFIAVAVSAGALNVAWLYIQEEFKLPLSSIGILLALPAVGRLLVSFYSGRLIKQFGVSQFLLGGSMLAIVGMLGFAFTPSWALLVVASMVMDLGGSVLINGLNIFVASNYASSRMNWLHASFGLGATIGPILITVLVLDLGLTWRAGYVVMAGVVAMFGGLMLITFKHWQLPSSEVEAKSKNGKTKNETQAVSNVSIFKMPIVWFGVAIMALSAGIETSTGQLSNSLFVDGRGYDPRMVATWISLYWLSFTMGRFITGLVIDRIDHNLFLRVSMIFAIMGASLVWLNPSPALNFAGLALMGFAMAPIAPTIMGDTPRRVGIERAPNMIGYQSTGAGIGIAFFPALAGVLAEYISLEMIGLFLIVLTVTMFIVHELLNYQERHEVVYDNIE